MYIYIEKNNEIVKYKVNLDRKNLIKFKNEIINNYSQKICFDFLTSYVLPELNDCDHIKNYNATNLDFKPMIINDTVMYKTGRVKFDYYIYPCIVELINDILDNNVTSLDKIYSYQSDIDRIDVDKIYCSSLAEDILTSLQPFFGESITLNNIRIKLRKNLDSGSFNEDKYSIEDLRKILDFISYEKIDTLSVEEHNRYLEFYELKHNKLLSPKIGKTRNRRRMIDL